MIGKTRGGEATYACVVDKGGAERETGPKDWGMDIVVHDDSEALVRIHFPF